MQRFLKKIGRLFMYWCYWVFDYIYVGFWQLAGFIRRGDASRLIHSGQKQKNTPVILIPGVYERWEFMKPIAKSIFAAGYDIHVIEGLGYNRGSVEQMAEIVNQYVRERELKSCVIVAHSKGGLIGKYLLAYCNEERRFIGMTAISTPFTGSVYAQFLPVSSLRIFAPNSPLLSLLAKNAEVNKHIFSIYGKFDPHIPGGSFLEGATNIKLQTYGHFRIVNDKRVHCEIIKTVGVLTSKVH